MTCAHWTRLVGALGGVFLLGLLSWGCSPQHLAGVETASQPEAAAEPQRWFVQADSLVLRLQVWSQRPEGPAELTWDWVNRNPAHARREMDYRHISFKADRVLWKLWKCTVVRSGGRWEPLRALE